MQQKLRSGLAIALVGLTMVSCKSGDDETTANGPGVESVPAGPTSNAHSIWRPVQEARPEDCTQCGATVDRLDVTEMLADGPVIWVDLTHFAVFPEPQDAETASPELFARVNDCSVPSPPMTGTVLYNQPDEASTLMIDLSDMPDGRISLALRVFYVEQSLPPLRKAGNQVSLEGDSGTVRMGADGEEVHRAPGCPDEGAP